MQVILWLPKLARLSKSLYQWQKLSGSEFTNGNLVTLSLTPQLNHLDNSSGDTGVSASLTLRGTPPFQVYYRMQRDNEPTLEKSEIFATSRGEITLQPDRSGHYTFTFTQLSDAHYKKVELNGPSIDQVIHPLAGADFITTTQTGNRRRISSCEGETISVDVDLKV